MPPLSTRLIRSCLLPMLIGLLTACGGGGGGGGGGGSILSNPDSPPRTPAPVFERVSPRPMLHVGTQASPGTPELRPAGSRNGISLYEGTRIDGTSEDGILGMLAQITPDCDGSGSKPDCDPDGPSTDVIFPITFRTYPTVRVVEGAPLHFREAVRDAVAILNSVLPRDRQMRFDERPVASPADIDAVPDDHIHVEYSNPVDPDPLLKWSRIHPDIEPSHGITWRRFQFEEDVEKPNQTRAGWVGINSESDIYKENYCSLPDSDCTGVTEYDYRNVLRHNLVHELLHALGLWGHVTDENSVLSINANFGDAKSGRTFVLSAKDKDLIHAVFTRVPPDRNPASAIKDLGEWSQTSNHRMGVFGTGRNTVAFGVWTRNDLIQPWAEGPAPTGVLGDATFVAGTAHWDGVFLGYTSAGTAVTGGVRLSVTLADMTAGTLAFSDLKQAGGTRWGDGDLDYTVTIADGRFDNQDRTGPDAGVITGVFLGTDHEAMAGTLRRDDLAGAFGGKN